MIAGFNAGMRGKKGSYYDGGHRVPCFWRWPAGGLSGARDIGALTAHVDLLPTLIELCALPQPAAARFDGISLAELLRGKAKTTPPRFVIEQFHQASDGPKRWDKPRSLLRRRGAKMSEDGTGAA